MIKYINITFIIIFCLGICGTLFFTIIINNRLTDTYIPLETTIAISDTNQIKAGQIWVCETDNPFEEDIYWYIIETKGDYVKFTSVKYNKDEDFWIIPTQKLYGISQKIDMFKKLYERVK